MESESSSNSHSYFPESTRTRKVFNNLLLHVHPTQVRKVALKFTHTWGLGGMALILFLLQVVTGILLRFVYQASPAEAYDSILGIQNEVFFGQFVRNIHHFSGMFMVIIVFLHFLRTFYTEAYTPPRQMNWIIGIGMMLAVVLSNFSGYLLPWDQLSYWAVTIATSMLHYIPVLGDWLQTVILGGNEVGSATLINFYNYHTAFLPLVLVVLMGFHFWKVRKAGGVVVPGGASNPDKDYVPTIPYLAAREFVVTLVLLAVILLVSALWNAPLQERANPALSPNPAKAPWYFLGIQELLMHFHPFFAAFVFPAIILGALIWLPFSRFRMSTSGIWFASKRGRILCGKTSILAIVLVVVLIVSDEWLPDLLSGPGQWAWLSEGLLPSFIILSGMAAWIWWLAGKGRFSKNEIVQAVFTFIIVSYIVLTIVGIWFRGPGMALVWPWMR